MTTFIDMKFGLLLFLLFILSIISPIITDGLFQQALFNDDGTLQKLRQKASNSKYNIYTHIFSYLFRYISVADNLFLL